MVDIYEMYIDSKERIFLNGEQVKGVNGYTLSHTASTDEPAKLTLTIYVNVGQVGSESMQ